MNKKLLKSIFAVVIIFAVSGTASAQYIGSTPIGTPSNWYEEGDYLLPQVDKVGDAASTEFYGDGSNLTGISTDDIAYIATTSELIATSSIHSEGTLIVEATSTLANILATIVEASDYFSGLLYGYLIGDVSGNASTSDALAINPADCAVNQFANTIAASGDLTCSAIIDADVPDTITASNYVRKSTWTDHDNYPADCDSSIVQGLGDTLTCVATTSWDTDIDGCNDCLNETEIENIYVLNSSDTMSGTLGVSGTTTLATTTATFLEAITISAYDLIVENTIALLGYLVSPGMDAGGFPIWDASYIKADYFRAMSSSSLSLFEGELQVRATTTLATTTATRADIENLYVSGNVGIGTTSPKYMLEVKATSTDGFFGVSQNTAGDLFAIDNSGNVGIGTASPSAKLSIKQSVASVAGGILLTASDSAYGSGLYREDGQYGALVLRSQSVDTIFIKSGKVGIGTTTPSEILHLFSATDSISLSIEATAATERPAIYLKNDQEDRAGVYFYGSDGGTVSEDFGFIMDNSNAAGNFFIDGQTYAGVGFTAPVSAWHIYENTAEVDGNAGLTIEQDGTGDATLQFLLSAEKRWGMGLDNDDANKFKIGETVGFASDVHFTIDVGGNIGIGTTSPTKQLVLSAPAGITEFMIENRNDNNVSLYLDAADTGEYASIIYMLGGANYWTTGNDAGNSNNYRIYSYTKSGGGDAVLSIDVEGNVGIGTTSPSGTLEVSHDGSAHDLIVNATTGNVGIGTAGPIANLQVFQSSGAIISAMFGDSTEAQYDNVYIRGAEINSAYGRDSATGVLVINAVGYQGGVTQFRDLAIQDGKETTIMFVDGSAGNIGIGTTTPYHSLQVDGAIQSDGFYGNMAHLEVYSTTTQTIAVVNTAQEVIFEGIADEHGDWNIDAGVSTSTVYIPNTGTYIATYEFQPSQATGGTNIFEFAAFLGGSEILASAQQRTLSGLSDIGDTDRTIHFEANAGDSFLVKMAGDDTAIQISATSSVFTTASSYNLIIHQLDGD